MTTPDDSTAKTKQKGSALIMVVFTLFLVMLVISAIFVMAQRNLLSVSKDHWTDKSAYAGRAGIEHAIAYLTVHPEFAKASTTGGGGDTLGENSMEDEPDVTYTVDMLNNDGGTEIDSPDGKMKVPPGVIWVKSVGKIRDRAEAEATTIIKLVGYQRPILKHSLFAMDTLEVSGGSKVYAYDSAAASANPPAQVPNRADIGTNSTLVGAVTLTGSGTTVQGEARAGVGTNLSAVNNVLQVNSGATLTGNRLVSEEATQIPRFIIDSSDTPRVYDHRVVIGNGVAADGEDPAKVYFHRVVVDTNPIPVDQKAVSYVGPEGDPPVVPYTPGAADDRINDRPILSRGGYDLNPSVNPLPATPPTPQEPAGTIRIKNAILKRGLYYFKGNLILDGHINVDPGPPGQLLDDPCVIYVDGDITITPGAKINWDGYNSKDFDGDSLTDEPLSPRLLQLYTVLDANEDFNVNKHTLTCGGTGTRTKASFVTVGANLEAKFDNTDYFGGSQALKIQVLNGSNAYFDVDLYGKPLEGRGELAVLVSTVSVYATSGVVAAGPPIVPSSTAPAPTITSTWSCSALPPLPASYMQPCY